MIPKEEMYFSNDKAVVEAARIDLVTSRRSIALKWDDGFWYRVEVVGTVGKTHKINFGTLSNGAASYSVVRLIGFSDSLEWQFLTKRSDVDGPVASYGT
jgi:hypothetical protein